MPDTADHFIAGRWIEGEGPPLISTDPATGQVNWEGRAATSEEIDRAVAAARAAAETWAGASLPSESVWSERSPSSISGAAPDLAESICRETGKPRWEALAEVDAMAAKVPTLHRRLRAARRPAETPASGTTPPPGSSRSASSACFGPFNFPGHLPNGHLVPAVLAGNTAVFKPSEQAPLVGRLMAEAWQEAVESVGARRASSTSCRAGRRPAPTWPAHPGLDGLLFTGSYAVGRSSTGCWPTTPKKSWPWRWAATTR